MTFDYDREKESFTTAWHLADNFNGIITNEQLCLQTVCCMTTK